MTSVPHILIITTVSRGGSVTTHSIEFDDEAAAHHAMRAMESGTGTHNTGHMMKQPLGQPPLPSGLHTVAVVVPKGSPPATTGDSAVKGSGS